MRTFAEIENGVVVNTFTASETLTETEINDRLQKRQAALMQVKNDDETPYYSDVEITSDLDALEAELRADPWADYVAIKNGAGIGWTYDAQTRAFTAPERVERFADLSRRQFEFLLALTGFGEVWDAIADSARAQGDMETYAALKAERAGSKFRHEVTLAAAAKFRPMAPVPTDSEISAAWKLAEKFKGVGA